VAWSSRTRSDQNGCFAFERVAPGVLTVGRAVPEKVGGSQALSNPVEVELAPGQTAGVQIGGPAMGRRNRERNRKRGHCYLPTMNRQDAMLVALRQALFMLPSLLGYLAMSPFSVLSLI
jgi:hypothetical protein